MAQGDVARVEGNEALQWLTSDMNMYVTIVKDTVAATLPKVAVMMLLERIITNELQRRLQRMALQVRSAACLAGVSVCLAIVHHCLRWIVVVITVLCMRLQCCTLPCT